jgi:hypothetical protein
LPRGLDTWLTAKPWTTQTMTGLFTCTFHCLFRKF